MRLARIVASVPFFMLSDLTEWASIRLYRLARRVSP